MNKFDGPPRSLLWRPDPAFRSTPMTRWSSLAAILFLSAGCAGPASKPPATAEAPPTAAPAPVLPPSGLVLANFDRSVRPQDDLFRFVNGSWLARTEIPADRSNYGAFNKLADDVETNLRSIAEEAAASTATEGTEQRMIGDLHSSFMDEARAEQLGLTPLDGELSRIEGIKTRATLVDYLSHMQVLAINNPVAMAIQPDAKRPDVYTIYADQAGLGMPDRDYYLSDDAKFVAIRAKYQQYLIALLEMTGHKDATRAASAVMSLESRLAKAQWPNVDLRNVDKVYNPFDLAGAGKLTPAIDWPRYLEMMGVAGHDSVIIGEPGYFKELSRALGDVPLATWRDYLRARVVDDLAPYLNKAAVDLAFDFNGRTITGTPEIRPRWKRALSETEAAIGDTLGKAYVARHYPPAAKARMDQLIANLRGAFAASIDELEWMGPETRRAAHAKLDSFAVKIGYPEKWKDYPGLVIRRDDLVGNVLRAREVNHRREVRKLGQPIDRTEWFMTPQTVNAYYNPLANEIVFPAAILQPPFFDMNADDAVNYGGIGAVIGHEISHGFDDQGRKFDGQGMLRDWWTAEDKQRFQAHAGALVSQYSAFSPLPGLNVNGELTLGENIGDLSGLAVAYKAYQRALEGKPAPVIDGFTGEQRFFLGWGQIWARKYRDDEMRKRILTDPHSPSEYRCNGVARNMPQFAAAFEVKAGDRLYLAPEQQVRIW
jgi:predicted metalloendopeptidase